MANWIQLPDVFYQSKHYVDKNEISQTYIFTIKSEKHGITYNVYIGFKNGKYETLKMLTKEVAEQVVQTIIN